MKKIDLWYHLINRIDHISNLSYNVPLDIMLQIQDDINAIKSLISVIRGA